jgi:hypothetical protein
LRRRSRAETRCVIGVTHATFQAFAPQIICQSKFQESRKDESCTRAHPHVDCLKLENCLKVEIRLK